ncbi:MAG: Rieske 2Fe-2S domain-containing protein [Alphaproteobacteria bacterium]|nr:Rieske 2Fe-2S domain-containing protein [Alphaproteobacteria bacterium]
MTIDVSEPVAATPRRVVSRPIPAEGENGLFRQSWYPMCLSSEVAPGTVIGKPFLDGRVAIFRGQNGQVRVVSSYCPHVGADLSIGDVVGDNLRCAFHHWEYDQTGQCVKTGIGDAPPKGACLFNFPSEERFGIVWAFNGETPLFELPQLSHSEDEMLIGNYRFGPLNCDPWVFAANTPDMQHLKAVHGVKFATEDPHDIIEWEEWGLQYRVQALHQGGIPLDWKLGLRGSSFFWREGTYDNWYCAAVTGFGLPRAGTHEVLGAYMVLKGEGAEERFNIVKGISERTIGEDEEILNTIHYRPGTLTEGDKTLAKYLQFLRRYPMAHPSAEFIR